MDNREDLSRYRLSLALETLDTAKMCYDNGKYRDANNRTYYAVFYAIRAVLALEGTDFKRHKDVLAYFNKEYVATGVFPRMIGRNIGILKQIREDSDYDDFYLATKSEALEQIETAENLIAMIDVYCKQRMEAGKKWERQKQRMGMM